MMSEFGESTETISCSNCKRDILQANFVIHELHCQRYIYLCLKCNEPVNYKQKDAHDKANHVLVFCKNCHAQMEKFLLNEHLINDCPHRKLKCQICDIEVSASDILEHESYCGARTEKCVECGEYIMFKYKQLHVDSNHKFIKLSDEFGPSPSWQNGRRTLGNFLPDFDSITYKSQTNLKKKSGKSENKLRRARGSVEYFGKDDEMTKESSDGRTNNEDTFPGNINQISQDMEEFQGSLDCVTDSRLENQTLKKSFSSVAASQIVDSTKVNSDPNKDTISRVKKGKGVTSRKDSTSSETASKETSGSDQKTKFSDEIDNDRLIAQAIEENAAGLSKFRLSDSSEKNKSLTGKNQSENTYNGELGRTVRMAPVFELDDSSDDEFLGYSNKTGKELDDDGLPCQFCGSLYPAYALMSHQRICYLNQDFILLSRKKYNKKRFGQDDKEGAVTCSICSQLVPFSRYDTHQIMHDMAAKN